MHCWYLIFVVLKANMLVNVSMGCVCVCVSYNSLHFNSEMGWPTWNWMGGLFGTSWIFFFVAIVSSLMLMLLLLGSCWPFERFCSNSVVFVCVRWDKLHFNVVILNKYYCYALLYRSLIVFLPNLFFLWGLGVLFFIHLIVACSCRVGPTKYWFYYIERFACLCVCLIMITFLK